MVNSSSDSDLDFANSVSTQIIHQLKYKFPDLTVDQLGSAMVYAGCFLLSASIPDLHKELKHSANLAYQCLVQSRQTKLESSPQSSNG